MANPVIRSGILPYDTVDDSVVLRCPLTSAASITDLGGTINGSGHTYDSELGALFADTGGASGCTFSSSVIAALASMSQGQISFEVERQFLGHSVDSGTANYVNDGLASATSIALLMFGSGGAATIGGIYKGTVDGQITLKAEGGGATVNKYFVNGSRNTRFARVTMSWIGSQRTFWVDGQPMHTFAWDGDPTQHNSLYLCHWAGGATAPWQGTHYVRNLVVAKRAVMIPYHRMLRRVIQYGDSYAGGQPLTNSNYTFDSNRANQIIAGLNRSGFQVGEYLVRSNGGATIIDGTADNIEADVDASAKTRAQMVAEDASFYLLLAGHNDQGPDNWNAAAFETDLHDHVDECMGVNGYSVSRADRMLVVTTPQNGASTEANRLAMNAIVRELPDWWNAEYPTRAGHVDFVDISAVFGEYSADSDLFSITDRIHPSPNGSIPYAEAVVRKMIQMLGRP